MLAVRELAESCPAPVSCLESRVSLSERDLAHLWEGQRFPPAALNTRDGRPLAVVYRGRPMGGPGPDFRDAVIAAPWGLLQGDVELHVRASDFRRHGHGQDPAYDGLALHVVFWDDEGQDTLLASGRRVPVAALAPWTERRARQIREWLERPALWQEPCRSAPQRLGAEAIAAALDEMGERRLRDKAQAMRRLLEREPADEVVWQGVLEALGYGGDRQAFRALATRLPWRQISMTLCRVGPRQRLEAARRLLLAAAGPSWGASARQRPGNEGWRRLEGAARLASRFAGPGLAPGLLPLLRQSAGKRPRALVEALTVAGFIGRSRALEIIVNVVLPYAAACGDADPSALRLRSGQASLRAGLARQAAALYGRLPRPAAYGAVRHLDRALRQGSGQALAGAVRVDARRQQGMLQLLRQYCSQGGCGRCPLS